MIRYNEAVFGYFVITQFIELRATSFVSLNKKAGNCREVPVGVTGLYSLDTSGYWSSNPLYNPSSAIYSIRLNNFLKTNAAYRSSITDIRAKLKEVGQKINKIDFGLSLLYWMSWSTTVSDGSSSYKFQLSGDTRVIFDRSIQESYMSNVDTDCRVTSDTAYNPINGKFTISFPVDEYKLYCNGISTAEDLGYNNQSYSNTLDIKWDVVSHATATAINEKVSIYRMNLTIFFFTIFFLLSFQLFFFFLIFE